MLNQLKGLFNRINLKKINLRRLLQYALYLFLTMVLQNMILTHVRPLGVCPFILPAAVVAVGMFEGSGWGAVFGLIMGLYADMAFVDTTVGFTLLLPLLAFGAGFIAQFFINRRFIGYMVVAAAALLISALMQMLWVLVSDSWSFAMLSTALLQTLWSLPLAALLYFPPARWID
jgi:cell shape-determining protein MreD